LGETEERGKGWNMKIRPIVSFVLVIVFLISVSPMSTFPGAINSHSSSGLSRAQSLADSTDWWPMFHHDPSHSGYSTSTAPNTNRIAWTYTTGGALGMSSPAVVDGMVYIGSGDYNVYCLNASTGTQIWNYTTGSRLLSSPAVAGGMVYIGSWDCNVYCLNASTGTQIWNYTTGNGIFSSPAVVDGMVYIGSLDGNVYCLNASTGTQVWNYATGASVYPSPAVAEGTVYVDSDDGHFYCLDASTGTQVWNYTTSAGAFSSPAVADGMVYTGVDVEYNTDVYCLNASTGTQVWNYTTGDLEVQSSVAVAGGMVYVPGINGHFYCLNASTGTQIWNYTMGPLLSSPAVAGGMVYIGSYDHNVYCLNASTGTQIWNYTAGNSVMSSPAVANGMVFIGSDDGNVYAFGVVHDIAVTGVTGQTVTGQNMTNVIQVTVVNLGNSTETFNLTAYYNGTAILNERWLPDTPSAAFYGMGDADRDGYIDGWDIDMIRQAFGWTGPPGQNPADINLDGKVLGDDMITCAKNYGKDIWTVLGLPRLIEDHEVVVLQPGFWAIIAFRWNTTGLAKGNYTVSVYAWPVQDEANTADNNYTFGTVRVAMVGDVNGDGKVDGKDLGWVAWCFGSYPGSPTIYWNQNCDINSDGKVDGKDLGVPASLFGQADP
jgi:outer membrane protein assembly factor BamB